MPVPLALGIAGGIGAAAGAGQLISGLIPSEMEKKNKERLERLYRMEETGKLGLSGREEQIYQSQLLDPVRSALAAQQRDNEAKMAASGMTSGAQLAAMRQERGQAMGQAQVAAGKALTEADVAKQKAQKAEIAQREAAAQDAKQGRSSQAFAGLGQIANAAGLVAGSVPEVMRMAGIAGAPIREPAQLQTYLANAGVPQTSIDLVMQIPPDQLTTIAADVAMGKITSPYHQALAVARDLVDMQQIDATLNMGSYLNPR